MQTVLFEIETSKKQARNNKNYIPVQRVQLIKETRFPCVESLSIKSSSDAIKLVHDYFEKQMEAREVFIILCLDTKYKCTGICPITYGTLDASLVHPREVFKPAILANSSAIILGHNHPSGCSIPSREDINVTKRMIEASKLIGIDILDHIISGREGLSMRETCHELKF